MRNGEMGKVVVSARIENLHDALSVEKHQLPAEKARSVTIPDALVDTGATILSLPRRLVDQLGLNRYRTRRVRTSAGTADAAVCEAVRLTVQGRNCSVDVLEIPDDCPVLIGQVPLEVLDFVVDPRGQKLIGNPEHGGEQMAELYALLPGSPLTRVTT